MKTFLTIVLLLSIPYNIHSASINIGESTSLENLINNVDSITYDNLSFGNWQSFGGLGITPQNTFITKLDDYRLDIQTSSPGFSLIGFNAIPSSTFQLANLTIIDDSPGLETVTALGDLANTTQSNNILLNPDNNTDILSGLNSTFGGTLGFDFDLNPIIAVPETTYLSTGAIAGLIALMFRRKRTY